MFPLAPGADRYFFHEPYPFLIQFPDGFFIDGIRFYGLAYILGFVAAWYFLKRCYEWNLSPLDAEKRADFSFCLILGVMIGGRMGYMLFYRWEEFVSDPLMLFRVWEGGMASHGGFIGVGVAVAIFAVKERVSFWRLADLCVVVAPIGIFLGRLANFVNGELWGKPTQVAWAVVFSESSPVYLEGVGGFFLVPRHPSQLYAALLEGLLVGVVLCWRLWSQRDVLRAGRRWGLIACEFLVVYGLARIVGEQFREPDASLFFGFMSRGVFYSIFMLAAGLALWPWRYRAGRG